MQIPFTFQIRLRMATYEKDRVEHLRAILVRPRALEVISGHARRQHFIWMPHRSHVQRALTRVRHV